MPLRVLLVNKITLTPIILLFPFLLFSQNTLIIRVIDKIDESPINNIKIDLDGNIFYTNVDGNVKVELKKRPKELLIEDFRYYPKKIKLNQSKNILIELTHKGFILDDIVINSNLFSKKLKNNNTSTSIIDDIKFRKNEGEFLINALNQVNGLYSHSAGYNTNRITIRGMGSRSPYSTNKIKAYLNNIPLSNGVGETTIEDIGIDILDQVEINKGPNSSIYGSGLGGNIILNASKNLKVSYANCW